MLHIQFRIILASTTSKTMENLQTNTKKNKHMNKENKVLAKMGKFHYHSNEIAF
jgi:hypothetical protein